jgi:integrase
MSVYFVKGKGWRYDFTYEKNRYTEAWFKTKTKAKQAEAKRREELKNPKLQLRGIKKTQTDMDFLTLANKRLDYVKKYNSEEHFRHVLYHVRRWIREWKELTCSEITSEMVETYIIKRSDVSPYTANKDLRYLRALFNYGIKRKLISENPTNGIEFIPEDRKKRYVPPKEDVFKVINVADTDTQDYLWAMLLTAARVNEINSMTWDDVNFEDRYVTLWTRKKKGGNREPRDVPMVSKLYDILIYRFQNRDPEIPWVFWHSYWSRKLNQKVSGPYGDRKKIMKTLCTKAGVRYFRFHPFRHLTASILDDLSVPIGVIQRILGHENRSTTEGYLHSIGEAERKAMHKLEKVDIFSKPLSENDRQQINMHREYWLRKAKRPDYETLCDDLERLGYVGTGKKYGVSDNAIRKWKKHYENRFEN